MLAPLAALVVFQFDRGLDPRLMQLTLHFWIVSGTAVAAGVACLVVVASARTLRETKLLFLALAFAAIAGVFSVHGLMTPGFIAGGYTSSIGASAWISIIAGASFVALSACELPRPVDAAVRRGGTMIFAATSTVIGGYVAFTLTHGSWLDLIPQEDRAVQYTLGLGALAMFVFGIWRYAQAYRFARLPSQAAMVVALVLLAEVPLMLLYGSVWHLSWWMYHATYAAAFVVLFAGWGLEVRRAGSLRAIADALSMRDALAQLNRGRDAHVLRLVDAIEAKDIATLGHVSRVSAYALRTGREMNLPPQDLRALVLAAQMHDVGKIGVPDHVLLKPGPLTDDEYAEVKRHAARGDGIAMRVDALRALAPVIRAHHERMDGSGYPDGLAGDAIPLFARVIAVADTYDAMTSTRPYRAAMAHGDAVAELRRIAGTELDAGCVAAFLTSFEGEQRSAA